MRITPGLTIAGYPAIELRDLFHRVLSRHEGWTEAAVADHLRIAPRRAHRLVTELARLGYLTRREPPDQHAPPYVITRQGAALIMATAAKPITRATADRIVAGLLERARVLAGAITRSPSG